MVPGISTRPMPLAILAIPVFRRGCPSAVPAMGRLGGRQRQPPIYPVILVLMAFPMTSLAFSEGSYVTLQNLNVRSAMSVGNNRISNI